ncbi:lysostaphin resistance A-like protein [Amaricoccus macauensis]|uniref:CPBP family intramembrane glutamic endopeptidase n=1 Tax=Amaricoccus macauensis TaxID=57001 RepID=UPI003C7A328D
MTVPTSPFEAYIAPVGRHVQVWRTLLGCVIIAATWGVVTTASALVLTQVPAVRGHPAGMTLLILYLFGGMTLGAVLAARLAQRRNAMSLVSPQGFRPRLFWMPAAGLLAVLSIGTLIYILFLDATPNVPPGRWLMLLPFGLLGVLIQTSAEEIVFRGYLMQSLAARFRSRIVWLGVPSILFGALHWDATIHGPNAWLVVASATLVGLIFADVTARCGDLLPAIGLHFANNALALLVLAPPSPLAGLSLFEMGGETQDVATMRLLHLSDIAGALLLYGIWFGIWGRHMRLQSGQGGPISAPDAGKGPRGT